MLKQIAAITRGGRSETRLINGKGEKQVRIHPPKVLAYPLAPPMRLSLPYHPDLGSRLRAQSKTGDRAIWIRLGVSRKELFSILPASGLALSNQSLIEESARPISRAPTWDDFWASLKRLLASLPASPTLEDLPFRAGLMGFLGYEQSPVEAKRSFPTAFMGFYPRFIYIDHLGKTAEFISLPGFETCPEAWKVLLEKVKPDTNTYERQSFHLPQPFAPLTPPKTYRTHFARIQAYLRQGDCYQVNYAQCFRATCQGSSAMAMDRLLEASNPAYAAWVSLPEGEILSLSPELFLKVENGLVLSKPIKGTAPRSATADEDARLREELRQSPKNRAENLMIVDLLRHDIGRHAEVGSVKADPLFEVESLPQVHHLVSTVTGKLKADSHVVDLIRDAFPGGSITGAPKKRAMEIIRELEPTRRSIYCGSIGYINADGDAHLNIAIRTLLRIDDELYTWAGGGIVVDSECEAEYQECFHKIGALMRILEKM